MKECKICGRSLSEIAKFCGKCGSRVERAQPLDQQPNAKRGEWHAFEVNPEWRTSLDHMLGESRRHRANPQASDSKRSPQDSAPSERDSRSPHREEILITPARCCLTSKPFGIRFELNARGVWNAVDALPMPEGRLEGNIFSSTHEVRMTIGLFFQCRHCSNKQFVVCNECLQISCAAEPGAEWICPWKCGSQATLGEPSDEVLTVRGAPRSIGAGNEELKRLCRIAGR